MHARLSWRNWWFSIFAKLLAMFCIVIVPVYALALHMNEAGARIVKQEIADSLEAQIRFYNTSLNEEIKRMVRLQREYVNDHDLLGLSVLNEGLSDYDRSVMMRRFQYKLNLMKSSGVYVVKASAYIPPLQRVGSSEGMWDTLSTDALEQLKRSRDQHGRSPLYYKDGRLFIREYYPSTAISPGRDPIFVLESEISVGQLQRFLQQISRVPQGGAAMVGDQWTIAADESRSNVEAVSAIVREKMSSQPESAPSYEPVRFNNQSYIFAYEHSPDMNFTLLVYVPESEVLGPLEKYRGLLMLITAAAALLIVVASYSAYLVIHKPLTKIVRAFQKVELGNLALSLRHNSRDEFGYLYQQFNGMTAKLRTLIYEVYELKLQTQQAELNQLQSQINPHFLYNSLYLLYRMIKAQDYENSLNFTKYLGDYFRYITKKTGDEVPLEQEWHHIRMYMEIQNLRFARRVQVTISDLPDAVRSVMVPRLLLQPVVENAYHHGFDNKLEAGVLAVTWETAGDELFVHVEDNGKGMTVAELAEWKGKLSSTAMSAEVSGIVNVHRRLRLKFGSASGIMLSPGAGGGLKVTMRLQIQRTGKEAGSDAELDAGR